MLNGLSPLDSLFQFQPRTVDPALSPTDLSTNFNSIYNSLLTQKNQTSAQSAKTAFLQAEFSKQLVLEDMFADPKTSFLGFGISNLFGVGGPFGLPSWAYDAQRVLGDANTQNLIHMSQQAAALAQSSISSLGSSSSGDIFSSLT